MGWKKYAPLRRINRIYLQLPKTLKRIRSNNQAYVSNPPVLANSFPKSGTHLLLQILEGLPRVEHFGSFVASMPGITFEERSPSAHLKLIERLIPGEICPAHLFFDDAYAQALSLKNAVHYFIYRDPRDVVVSEAHYLTHMNRWHRMHRYFKTLDDPHERISAAIMGFSKAECPFDYPDVSARFRRYKGWLERPDVMSISFEGLLNERKKYLLEIVSFHAAASDSVYDREKIVENMIANINPQTSHTFRRGEAGGWKKVFTGKHKEQMKAVAGKLLVELGYEQDLDW